MARCLHRCARASSTQLTALPRVIQRAARALRFIWSQPHRSFRWRGKKMTKSRRQFLRDTACGLTAAAMVNSLDRLSIVNAMVQQQPEVASDYKALVCVFLSGGSDCNNMVVPYTGYMDANGYSAARAASGLAVPKTALVQISPPNQGGNVFGFHPNLSPEVANAAQAPGLLGPWNQGK